MLEKFEMFLQACIEYDQSIYYEYEFNFTRLYGHFRVEEYSINEDICCIEGEDSKIKFKTNNLDYDPINDWYISKDEECTMMISRY